MAATLDDVYGIASQAAIAAQQADYYAQQVLALDAGNIAPNAYGAYVYALDTYNNLNTLSVSLNTLLANELAALNSIVKYMGDGPDSYLHLIGINTGNAATFINNGLNAVARDLVSSASLLWSGQLFNSNELLSGLNAMGIALKDAITSPTGWDKLLDTEIGASTWSDAVVRATKMMAGFGVDEGLVRAFGPSAGAVNYLENKGAMILDEAVKFSEGALSKLHAPALALADSIVQGVHEKLSANAPATPKNSRQRALDALGIQIGLGVDAHLIALAIEAVPYLKHIGFPQLAAFLCDGAGFQHVANAVVGSYIDAGVTMPGRQDAMAAMTPNYPYASSLEDLVRKRVVGLDTYRQGLQVAGFSGDWAAVYEQAVYRDPTMRDLALTLDDVSIDRAWLLQAVRRAGYSDEDADRVQGALLRRTTKTSRGKLTSAAADGVKRGFISPAEADTYMEQAGLLPDARTIEITAAQLSGRLDLINDTITAYTAECVGGVISVDDYQTLLIALGVDPSRIEVLVLGVEAKRGVKHLVDETTAAQAAIREAQRYLIPLYRDLFRSGVMTADTLNAALVAVGLTATLAGSIVSLEQQRVQAGVVTQAQKDQLIVNARIRAEQKNAADINLKSGVISLSQYTSTLVEIGFTPDEAAALTLEQRVRLSDAALVSVQLSDEAIARGASDSQRRYLTTLYREGKIDDGAFLSGLIAAGVDTALAKTLVQGERLVRDIAAPPSPLPITLP